MPRDEISTNRFQAFSSRYMTMFWY